MTGLFRPRGRSARSRSSGDAAEEETLSSAVALATAAGTLEAWVNNAAVFRDAAVHDTSTRDVLQLIFANLELALAGSAAAVRSSWLTALREPS